MQTIPPWLTPDSPQGFPPDAGRFFTVSNVLSLLRVALVVPFVFIMLGEGGSSRLWGAALMVVAGLTDKLDGMLARKYHQITEWGKILDPLADKIAIGAVVLVLLVLDAIPLWFVVVILARDVLILVGGIYLKARRGVVLPSNEAGKWAVGVIALTLFLAVLGVSGVVLDLLIGASLVMLALSSVLYVTRFIKLIRTRSMEF